MGWLGSYSWPWSDPTFSLPDSWWTGSGLLTYISHRSCYTRTFALSHWPRLINSLKQWNAIACYYFMVNFPQQQQQPPPTSPIWATNTLCSTSLVLVFYVAFIVLYVSGFSFTTGCISHMRYVYTCFCTATVETWLHRIYWAQLKHVEWERYDKICGKFNDVLPQFVSRALCQSVQKAMNWDQRCY